VPKVFAFHKAMLAALEKRDEDKAVAVMKAMLAHGTEHLRK